jgi:methionyl-tRNA synthetase
MAGKGKFYITTAISYPNGNPHIGHAYEVVATDAIARFKRLDGYDVYFQTGTDEHGLKIQQAASARGITPKALVDEISPMFMNMAQRLNCSFDRFVRTTDPDHYAATQELWRRMEANGDIYLGKYEGWYSVRDEGYFNEDEIVTGEDGKKRAVTSGAPVEWVVEESYFFRLSKYQDKLIELYESQPDFVGPETRRNEIMSFVHSGLQDISISRTTFDWGIPVPGAPNHVMYVWVDALNNYLTGCGFPDENASHRHYWPADAHIIGKDIIRFHTIYWPAFLMSAGITLPKRVFGHGFLFNRGEKMSKSVGNVIDPMQLIEAYGVDQLRYFFMREVPFGQDGNYSHDAIVNRINADLANDLGNLAQRSLSMIAKNCKEVVPVPAAMSEVDEALIVAAYALPEKARAAIGDFALHTILADIWAVVAETNRYFASQEPWVLRKTDVKRMETVLYTTAEVLRCIGIMVQPFIPVAAGKLLDLLAVAPDERMFSNIDDSYALMPSTQLPSPQPIFPRYIEPEENA